jgi:hypothetical protein
LTGPKRNALEAIAAVHVEAHGGDVEKSLAAVPANDSTRARLTELGEPEIEATLARLARAKNGHATEADDDNDPDRTVGLSLGTATSDGQRFRIRRPHEKPSRRRFGAGPGSAVSGCMSQLPDDAVITSGVQR